ncbi:hypothetical protein ACTHPV_19720 [Ferdinandcohnia sp. SAFN-114]
MRNPYTRMAIGLYTNYFNLKMINILFSSGMSFLTELFHHFCKNDGYS